MARRAVVDIVKEIVGADHPVDDGWEAYISCQKAWRWEFCFSDEQKAAVEKALADAGYKPKEVVVSRIQPNTLIARSDIGPGPCTYVIRY